MVNFFDGMNLIRLWSMFVCHFSVCKHRLPLVIEKLSLNGGTRGVRKRELHPCKRNGCIITTHQSPGLGQRWQVQGDYCAWERRERARTMSVMMGNACVTEALVGSICSLSPHGSAWIIWHCFIFQMGLPNHLTDFLQKTWCWLND